MILILLATLMKQKYRLVRNIISSHTYIDDAGVFGNSEEEVGDMANQVIRCLQEAAFKSGKTLIDNQKVMKSIPIKCLHPSTTQALEAKIPTVSGLIGNTVESEDPNVKVSIIECAN